MVKSSNLNTIAIIFVQKFLIPSLLGGTINNLCLICEVRPCYISFKLKSLLGEISGSKPFLFSTRIATSEITNYSRRIINKNEIQHKTLNPQKLGVNYCQQNCLAVVSEEEEEEQEKEKVSETDSTIVENDLLALKIPSKVFIEPEALPKAKNLDESEVLKKPEIPHELENFPVVEILQGKGLETLEISDFSDSKAPNIYCPCEVLVSVSKHSFSQIELKLQDLSECLKKFTSQIESNKTQEKKINTQQLENSQVKLTDVEKVLVVKNLNQSNKNKKNADSECFCSVVDLQLALDSSVNKNQETNHIRNQQNQSVLLENQNYPVPQDRYNAKKNLDRANSQENQEQENKQPQIHENFKKSEKSMSRIPVPISCRSYSKMKDLKKEKPNSRLFSCSQRQSSFRRQYESSNTCSVSKIPVLQNKVSKSYNSQRTSRSTTQNINSSIPLLNEKHENRLDSLASRKRSTTPSQRCSELSRCFATKSTIPKYNHMDAKTYNKTSTNVTFIKVNVSSTFLSKGNDPQPAKRIVLCPNPSPRRNSLSKIDQCICTESFPSVSKVDQKISANILQKEKPTFVIVTNSEEAIPRCDSECPCRGSFDIPDRNLVSCLYFEKTEENFKSENLSCLETPVELIKTQKSFNFQQDQDKIIVNHQRDLHEYSNLESHVNNSFSPKNENIKVSNIQLSTIESSAKNHIVKQKHFNSYTPTLKLMDGNLKANTFKVVEDCRLNPQSGLMRSNCIFNKKLVNVSVQTMKQKVLTKGINIDIREMKETISKGVNVVQREPGIKVVNPNVVSKDSVISLQTNVTKIISIIDITIFENGPRCTKPVEDFCRRGICRGCLKLMSPCSSSVSKGILFRAI